MQVRENAARRGMAKGEELRLPSSASLALSRHQEPSTQLQRCTNPLFTLHFVQYLRDHRWHIVTATACDKLKHSDDEVTVLLHPAGALGASLGCSRCSPTNWFTRASPESGTKSQATIMFGSFLRMVRAP